jgi:hypothetical protein
MRIVVCSCRFSPLPAVRAKRQGETVAGPIQRRIPGLCKDCLEEDNSGDTRLLTGQNLTKKQMADLGARKKERDAWYKPRADRLA